jgi:hypothetical protein
MPALASIPQQIIPKTWDRAGLPGWAYHSRALLELELDAVFLTHWQIVGHLNDLPKAGDYITMDIGSERVMVMRGADGQVRALPWCVRFMAGCIIWMEPCAVQRNRQVSATLIARISG